MMKKIRTRLIILLIMTCLTITTAYAYMYMKTQLLDNQFVVAEANCLVNETVENNTKKSITVENTGNINSYLRLIIFTYWVDTKPEQNIVGRQDKSEPNNGNPILSFNYDQENWIQDGNIYYCKTPIQVGDSTPNLLAEGSTIALQKVEEEVTSNGVTVTYEYNQVVEVIAEAIQADPEEAAEESWGVTITDNKITEVH